MLAHAITATLIWWVPNSHDRLTAPGPTCRSQTGSPSPTGRGAALDVPEDGCCACSCATTGRNPAILMWAVRMRCSTSVCRRCGKEKQLYDPPPPGAIAGGGI
jgi:hypothetical protein